MQDAEDAEYNCVVRMCVSSRRRRMMEEVKRC